VLDYHLIEGLVIPIGDKRFRLGFVE
jgi:hypothetical protein